MPVPTMLARGVALALMGVVGAGSAAQLDSLAAPTGATAPYGPPDYTSAPSEGGPAARLDYTLELGAEHSSNINYSQYDPISQDLLIPRLYFSYDQNGSTVQAHAVGQIEYRDYLQGDFNNELRGNLASALNWIMLPERLAFAVTDNSSVEPVNSLANDAPTNVQQTNVLSAGPTLLLHFSNALRAQAELRYISTTASRTKYFDSQRGSGALRLVRELDATDQVSANLEAGHVHFTDPGTGPGQFTPDYDTYSVYGRYQSKLAKIQLDAALGWSKYSFDQGAPDQSGVMARVLLNWAVTPESTLGIGATHQFTDASQQLIIDPAQIGTHIDTTSIAVGNAVITPQIYLEKRIDTSYAYDGPRLGFSITPFYRQQNYVNDPLYSQEGPGLGFDLEYRLRPLLAIGFAAAGERTRYTSLDRRDEFYSYGPSLTDQLTRHWSWSLNLTHNQQDSSQPGLSYTENLVFFVISYKR